MREIFDSLHQARLPARTEARSALESFRITYDFWSHAPEFNALVDELCRDRREFERWWKAHQIRPKPSGKKLMIHPARSRVAVHCSTFEANDDPDLRLVLYSYTSPMPAAHS